MGKSLSILCAAMSLVSTLSVADGALAYSYGERELGTVRCIGGGVKVRVPNDGAIADSDMGGMRPIGGGIKVFVPSDKAICSGDSLRVRCAGNGAQPFVPGGKK